MQRGRQFGIVYTSLYVYLKTLEVESFCKTEQNFQPAGRGRCLSSSPVVPVSSHSPTPLSSLPLPCYLGQGRGLQWRESCLCSSASVLGEWPDTGFWGHVYASLLLYLPWGSWSKDETLSCCYQTYILSRCSWSQHLSLFSQTFYVCGLCGVLPVVTLNLWALSGPC